MKSLRPPVFFKQTNAFRAQCARWTTGRLESTLESIGQAEAALGKDHPTTAHGVNGLATLYQLQGRYADAEPLCLRALETWEVELGADHPDTTTGLHNLAALYKSQGRYVEAEPLYVRAPDAVPQKLPAKPFNR